MAIYRLEPQVSHALDDIYRYTRSRWGEDQADRYINGLFAHFDKIADRRVPWRRIARRLSIDGYLSRYEHHFMRAERWFYAKQRQGRTFGNGQPG